MTTQTPTRQRDDTAPLASAHRPSGRRRRVPVWWDQAADWVYARRRQLTAGAALAVALAVTYLANVVVAVAVAAAGWGVYRLRLRRAAAARAAAEQARRREELVATHRRVAAVTRDRTPHNRLHTRWSVERWDTPPADVGDPDPAPRMRDKILYRPPVEYRLVDPARRNDLHAAFAWGHPYADWHLDVDTYRADGCVAFVEVAPASPVEAARSDAVESAHRGVAAVTGDQTLPADAAAAGVWQVERWEHPPATRDQPNPAPRIRGAVSYKLPVDFDVVSDARRQAVLDRFAWDHPYAEWEADWDSARERGQVTFRELQPLPRFVRWQPHLMPADADTPPDQIIERHGRRMRLGPYHLIPVGVGVGGQVVLVDLKAAPHILVTGSTGGGKSSVANAVFAHAFVQGLRITAIDPKLIGYSWLLGRPGVTDVALTPRQAQDVIADLRIRMYERYVRRFNGDPWDDTPELFAVDEFPELVDGLREAYAALSRDLRSQAPHTEHHMGSLARMARAVRIHLMVTLQRPDARFLEGNARAQYRNRILTSKVESGAESTMVFGPGQSRVGLLQDLAIPGRMLVDVPAGRVRAQGYWLANPTDPDEWMTAETLRELDAPADDPVLNGMTDGQAAQMWVPPRPDGWTLPRLELDQLVGKARQGGRPGGLSQPVGEADPASFADVPDDTGDWAEQIDAALDHFRHDSDD